MKVKNSEVIKSLCGKENRSNIKEKTTWEFGSGCEEEQLPSEIRKELSVGIPKRNQNLETNYSGFKT